MAVVIGIIGGITAIFARAFPNPVLVQRIALGALVIVGLFLMLSLFGWIGVLIALVFMIIFGLALILIIFIRQWKKIVSFMEKATNDSAITQCVDAPLIVGQASTSPDSPCDPEKVYQYSAERYGIGYNLLDVSCDLRYDGSATIKRKVTVEAFSRMNGLETSLLIPETFEPGAWSEQNRVNVASASQPYIVSLGTYKRTGNKQFVQIVFAPELAERKSLVFTLTEDLFPGIFAMGLSHKDTDKLLEKDYFGWNIDRPTHALRLQVLFPKRVKPKVFGTLVQYSVAFSDIQTARYHYEEQKGLNDPVLSESENGRYSLSLDVKHPMVGLTYTLFWLPISKKDEIPDEYSPYEIGLQNLLAEFDEHHTERATVLHLAQWLTQNIAGARLHGDSDFFRTERAESLRKLDKYAFSACKCSFQDLCR